MAQNVPKKKKLANRVSPTEINHNLNKENNTVFLAIIAGCLPVLLYLQTLSFGFAYFDDDGLILNNLGFLSNAGNIGKAFLTDAFLRGFSSFYRPLQTVSYMLLIDRHLII